VTNSGGYFLCHAGDGSGLPAAVFGSGGRATLTLVIGLAHPGTGPAPLAPYVNAVLGSGLTLGEAPFVASDSLSDAHPLTLPGQLAIQLTRNRPAEPGAADLGAALDQLYNLCAGRITAIGGTPLPDGEARVFAPDKAAQNGDDLVYRHSFPLVPRTDAAGAQGQPAAPLSLDAFKAGFNAAFVAQDRVELEVTVNQGNRQGLLFATGFDVVDALIAFDRLLPELQALLVAQGLAAIRSPDRADKPVLKAALDGFATLAQDIAERRWSPFIPEGFAEIEATGLVRRSRRFAIEDGVQKPGDPWMTRISISDKGAADLDILPMIVIDGYRTQVAAKDASSASYTCRDAQTGKPLTEDQGRALAERRVIVAPAGKDAPFGSALNVIDRQDGTMPMQTLRNARVHEAFRYATGWVRYPAPVTPQLDIAAPIDIADLAGAPGKPRPLARFIPDPVPHGMALPHGPGRI